MRALSSLAVLALAFAPSLSAPAAATTSTPTFSYGYWWAGCDNGLRCTAMGFAYPASMTAVDLEGKPGGGWIEVVRDAGPSATPTVIADAPAGTRLVVTGGPTTVTLGPLGPNGTVPASQVATAIRALIAGHQVRLGTEPGDIAVSLVGSAAALLWIDTRQGRVGTVTALDERGTKPASAVPPPPSLPLVAKGGGTGKPVPGATPAALKALALPYGCGTGPWQGYQLQGAQLWLAPCVGGSGGANWAVYLLRPGTPPQPVSVFQNGLQPDNNMTGPGTFDPTTMELPTSFRGQFECGSAARYRWNGQTLVLAEAEQDPVCQGEPMVTTYRTRS